MLIVWLVIVATMLSMWLLLSYDGPLSIGNQLLALSVAGAGLIPAVHFWHAGHRNDLPLFELLGCFFSISMGWTAMFKDIAWPMVDQETITTAYGVTWLALIGLGLGFYIVGPKNGIVLKTAPLPGPVPSGFLPAFGIGLMIIGVAAFFLPANLKGGWVEQVRGTLTACGLAAAWLACYRGDASPPQFMTVAGLTGMVFLIHGLTASMKPLLVVLITIGLAYVRAYRRIPFAMVAVAVIGVAMLNPVKYYWRAEVNASGGSLGLVENLSVLGDAIDDYYSGSNVFQTGSSEMTVNRFSDISLLTNTVSQTPDYVPYWGGETLKALVYSLIPRVLMPNKPLPHYGNQFGHRYGIIGESDQVTLVSLNWITELYINFGSAGVFIGMAIIGYVMRLIQSTFGSSKATDLQFAIGIGAVGMLYNGSENLSVVWGGLIIKIVMLIVIAHFAFKLSRALSPGLVRRAV